MAQKAVEQRGVSVRLACRMFNVSESCYRYQAKLRAEDDVIADWLVRLTRAHRNWGFGLCFLYLRNIKGFKWNHKRVYRVYRQLGLNLRIKPRKRLVRQAPEPLEERYLSPCPDDPVCCYLSPTALPLTTGCSAMVGAGLSVGA